MSFDTEFFAFEATEVHEYLDKRGIPRIKEDPDGKFINEGKPCYILPLLDRLLMWKALG